MSRTKKRCPLYTAADAVNPFDLEQFTIVRCRNCEYAKEYVVGKVYCINPANRERVGVDGSVSSLDAYEVSPSGFCDKGVPRP